MRISLKTLIITLGVVVVVGLVIAFIMFNSSAKDLTRVKPDYSITSLELFSDFSADEKAASEKYIGKVLEIRGVLGAFDFRNTSSGTVTLITGDPTGMVICRLASSEDIPNLHIGDIITIKGECSGMLMDVLVNNCVIVPFVLPGQ